MAPLVTSVVIALYALSGSDAGESRLLPMHHAQRAVDPDAGLQCIDSYGRVVFCLPVGMRYHDKGFATGGVFLIEDSGGLFGYVDTEGEWVIEPRYSAASPFSDGRAAVTLQNGEAAVIDSRGTIVFRTDREIVGRYSNERFRFRERRAGDEVRFGFLDTEGVVAVEPRFTDARDFHDGIAEVEIDGRWGVIDPSGAYLIQPQYDRALVLSEGLAAVPDPWFVDEGGARYGYIDLDDRWIIQPTLHYAGQFSCGLAPAIEGSDHRQGYIDQTGQTVIEPMFTIAHPFADGLACVAVPAADDPLVSRWGYINTRGDWAIAPVFERATTFRGGFADVTIEGLSCIINVDGRIIWAAKTSPVSQFHPPQTVRSAAEIAAIESPEKVFELTLVGPSINDEAIALVSRFSELRVLRLVGTGALDLSLLAIPDELVQLEIIATDIPGDAAEALERGKDDLTVRVIE